MYFNGKIKAITDLTRDELIEVVCRCHQEIERYSGLWKQAEMTTLTLMDDNVKLKQ